MSNIRLVSLAIFIWLTTACDNEQLAQTIVLSDSQIEQAISGSDDYNKYKTIFINSTKILIQNRKCSISEFEKIGGWVKSQSQKNRPIYFTYCGGMKLNNKIYLDASIGHLF